MSDKNVIADSTPAYSTEEGIMINQVEFTAGTDPLLYHHKMAENEHKMIFYNS